MNSFEYLNLIRFRSINQSNQYQLQVLNQLQKIKTNIKKINDEKLVDVMNEVYN